ncbi:MAG TPA: Gldg family protein [Gemmataceae bacterium]|nr:Gldg family protein [Gemmataceae bacterium]
MSGTQQTNPTGPRTDEARAKLVLLVGAVLGLALVVAGGVLSYRWRDVIVGGIEEWHKQWWKLLLCEVCVFGGLAVMFAALGLTRGEERTNPGMRRLLYGYNAVLSCLLLLTILAHLNVMAYLPVWPFTKVHATYDWTESSLYTLTPQSRDFLKDLQQPVKVIVLLPSQAEFAKHEMDTLLSNCRAVTDKIQEVSIDTDRSPDQDDQLVRQYHLPEREGVVVVYGPQGDEKAEFLRYEDLISVQEPNRLNPDAKPRVEFKGESALIRTLAFLQEGKARTAIYFTQGDGELDLNSQEASRDDVGLGRLRDRLTRAGYEVKELHLGVAASKVPDDAAIVIIARPKNVLPDAALNALRDYMKPKDPKAKKGKLIVLMDVIANPDGTMARTGLEDFLQKEFGVQVGNGRILCVGGLQVTGNPLDVFVGANARSTNPVAARLGRGEVFRDVRTVQPGGTNAPPVADYRAEPILGADPQYGIWEESNLNVDARDLVKSLLKSDRRAELQEKLSQQPLSVAVAVSELGQGPHTGDPHDFMRRNQEPRMLVFGDATWVSNRRMDERGRFDLFTAGLAWLRDKPDVAAVAEGKERKAYIVRGNPAEISRQLLTLPVSLISLGIIGLGAGIWVVRRR